MKKKLLATLLSLTMLVGMLPMSALAADESEPTYVAQVSKTGYTTLAEAVDAAESAAASLDEYGDLPEEATVILLTDLTISETIKIESPVKIDLAGRTLTCSARKAFELHADAIFVGGTMDTESGVVQGTIVNTYSDGRCIDTRTNVELKVQGIHLETAGASNPQPLTIGGYDNGTKVSLLETTIDAGKTGYGIITFVETELYIEQSSVTGYAALYMRDGSANSEVSVNGSELIGKNNNPYHESNAFATIILEDDNIELSAWNGTADTSIVAEDKNGSGQALLSLGTNSSITGAEVWFFDDVTLTTIGDAAGYLYAVDMRNNLVSIPEGYEDDFTAEGYVVDNGIIIGYNTPINSEETLTDAISNAENRDTITLGSDITLTDTLTIPDDKNITLDLNGYTISQEKACSASYEMIKNNGTLTVKDSGTDGKITFKDTGAGDPNFGWGSYTLSNSGTFVLDGGIIENDTPKMSHAYYTIQNGANGSVTINDGKVVNNTSYAIRQFASGSSKNTVTVNGGEVSGTRAVWMQAAGSNAENAPSIELTVNGGKLIGTGESADYTLAVYSYTYGDTLKNVKITVTGGTVEGDIALTGGKNKTVAETVVISGGELTDVYSYAADEVAKNTISITGGTFAVDPSNYLADGYTVTGNGPYIVHKVSTGGGSSSSGSSSGSSSSSDSDSTAETTTTINPDGSTTTTSTKVEVSEGKDGSTTTTTTTKETTKETDGSTTKSETVEETVKNADGTETSTSKTETTSSNGSKSTTTVDETGKMETEVTVSGTAVKNAAKTDVAVTLPMPEVSATADSETAPTVEVTLPANAGETKVEIPVANPTAGTVVVIVHDDGTEEIVKTSVVSEDGVIVPLTEDATIKVMDNSQDFIDVENNDWFNDASQFVSSREIMSGTSDDTFSPDLQASRGMIAVILHSLENDPENTYTGNFNDVGDTWYTDSIKWAAENGIMSGTGNGNFGPDDSVTREQLAVTLFAYANKKGIDTSANSAMDDFNDADNTSVWAKEAVEWAVAAGLLSGKDGGRLDPTGTASRAEIAQILMAFCSKVAM